LTFRHFKLKLPHSVSPFKILLLSEKPGGYRHAQPKKIRLNSE